MMHNEAKSASKSSLNQVLYEVTSEKIMELQRQKDVLSRHYSDVLKTADASDDLIQEIEILYQGIKEAPVQHKQNLNMESARLFIGSVAKDPSTSEQLLRHWIASFRKEIQYSTCKCTYTYMYGKRLRDELSEAETSALDDEFHAVSKKRKEQITEREKTIKELEKRVFEAGQINSDAFKAFLDKTLDMGEVKIKKVLDTARMNTGLFCKKLLEDDITVSGLKTCVEGLLGCDLLNAEKQTTLRQLMESEPYLQDLATLLSSRIKAVKYWNWPEKGVHVDVRRSIAGRYRAFLDEDIITALFLQYIGAQFAIHMKGELRKMFIMIYEPFANHTRKLPRRTMSIEELRCNIHLESFLSVLPSGMQNQAQFSYEDNGNSKNTTANTKNSLIHLLATEAQLHKVIKPDQPFTVVRTDMEWFGPSIEHESIKIVLQFLGVTDVWVDFMMRFLNVPMTFQKDVSEDVRIRRRGVPISHQLSALFGECILFMMEAAVKHQTGIRLYRVHDDFWFWDSHQDKVVQAWRVMNEYASLTNLRFNAEKSGSAVINGQDNSILLSTASFGPLPLPQARVWWGFLVFREDGLFQIDHALIEPHIEEMRQKLQSSKTVLSWVNVYNKYISFFMQGFGSCAKVLGTQHLDQIGKCMQMIQRRVFHEQNGNALAALKKQFEVFQSTDMLDMWAYWPLPAGGLGMKNYLMDIGALRETFIKVEHTDFTDLPKEDKVLWEEQEKKKEENRKNLQLSIRDLQDPSNARYNQRYFLLPQTFVTYCSGRETLHRHWRLRFLVLLDIVDLAHPVELNANVNTQLNNLQLGDVNDVITAKRVVSHYNNQLGKACGTLEFLDMALIPKSLVQTLNKAKVQWDA
ncbi:hypothetical protein K450DRAFT_272833 [Umbelopsis ramanniana AG]|uniref:Reverse transcriptase domain-containing protein n=1 Tax=Umbelopsis ramanniana AG TaxID=1314678 RepID=A0AAD5HBR3_UMBRA|nr:uncharacterized protein K450DRAFT_272833 [Umbelopsis ramanniana AG]KAI8578415.1 hypothetical protein K450DRAFT_272833 [Umbelopsis ramanniana AG]